MSIATILPQKAPRATSLKPAKFTRKQEKLVEDSLAFLTGTAPFFSYPIYAQMQIVLTRDVPWAATDAHTIFVNPEGWEAEKWGIEEGAFVLAHEACHYLFRDLLISIIWREHMEVRTKTRTLPYLHDIMNRAMDFRINAALIEAGIGKFPTIGCFDRKYSEKGMEDCVDIYDAMFPKSGNPDKGRGTQFDEHLEPSEEDQEKDAKAGQATLERVIAGAAQAMAQAGFSTETLPGIFRQLVGDVLDPKVKWADHLKATMARAAGTPRYNWRKVNRRLISRPVGGKIVFAQRSNYGCGTIVVGWDTSGSTHEYQDAFFAEMSGIVAELNPAELIVLRCDTTVHDVNHLDAPSDLDELRTAVNDSGIGGGGGTAFEPVFDWLKENDIEPDMLVYLTDLMGSFPDREPAYPVIWANIAPGMSAPFGTIVNVEIEE